MTDESKLSPLDRAIDAVGSQAEMARICGVSQPAVWKWVHSAKKVPAEYVLRVEAATGVSRHELRPDIYPIEEIGPVGTGPATTPAAAYSPAAGVDPAQSSPEQQDHAA